MLERIARALEHSNELVELAQAREEEWNAQQLANSREILEAQNRAALAAQKTTEVIVRRDAEISERKEEQDYKRPKVN